ncbi:deoxyguanosinetriphosphate triphosphohydrolase [Sphingomonas solaris]|uniref:Deoxyguanosinetriphosphate triphosphohydrolase-like protein n=1 Tax=Alterirhizorhabdus solaris TaxID=2529389 RepID=A0A558QT97_9SPHN|nr:deoxyguanosinetriphosphate triphosphohydrolase [Sphingomonas solaris]TVV70345.1 deoxyguanosinetriphosphate triphosphohydrolase [Sphingomonas solaris]
MRGMIAPFASDPAASRGRLHAEPRGETRGPRNAFQRDRDRIIHAIAFRRLGHKTQVFVAPDGDHYRVRLTHSLEVAQIGRTIARALGLDEDLTEALCLAHDIGHPPFGHSGEEALTEAVADAGGFDHNAHTLRVLTRIETPYPRWDGLNLSWETLEGLAKHNGPVADPPWALAEVDAAMPLDLGGWPSLEAQVAALADDIAYDNHDIDDGLRAGLIDLDDVVAQPLVAPGWAAVSARYPDLPPQRRVAELIREQIGRMVHDLLDATGAALADVAPGSADAVRGAGRVLACFSAGMAADERAFKRFMYARLYHHPSQLAVAEQARVVIAGLAAAYRADPALLPPHWRAALPAQEPQRARHIADFIAGMTDRYALARYRALIGPIDLGEEV